MRNARATAHGMSLTLSNATHLEPWGGDANPRTPAMAHAAIKYINANDPTAGLAILATTTF